MIFSYISAHFVPTHHVDPSRIAANVVTGVGFLGAGIILKSQANGKITNLWHAASIWFSASIDMAIGFDFYVMALIAIGFSVFILRMPHISKSRNVDE
jgi:putative Mg2+ transporter-C (MgtC) family protein